MQEEAEPKRRILISGGLAAGGVQTHISILCEVLTNAGFEITIAPGLSNWSQSAIDNLTRIGVRIVFPPTGNRSSRLAKVLTMAYWTCALRKHFDVLYCHGHGRMHDWMKRFLRPGGKSVYHEIVEPPERGSAMAQLIGTMNVVIASSDSVARSIADVCSPGEIDVVPCFSTKKRISRPAIREPIGDATLRVAFFGRLVSHKQPDWLVENWDSIAGKPPVAPARLDLYGGDFPNEPMLDRLREFVRQHDLDDQVRLHGTYDHNDVSILQSTDLAVLPSRFEGVPLVLLEAILHGVPFVAMGAGGIDSLAKDNPDVLVTSLERDAFVAAMVEMSKRLREGQVDSVRLHDWAQSRFGIDHLSERWCSFFETQCSTA